MYFFFVNEGESDSTPIVVIRELNCSPGKKNGNRKSLELPLIPVSVSFPPFLCIVLDEKSSIVLILIL